MGYDFRSGAAVMFLISGLSTPPSMAKSAAPATSSSPIMKTTGAIGNRRSRQV
jgi:hypothetical protein